jgi:hypothetical protein
MVEPRLSNISRPDRHTMRHRLQRLRWWKPSSKTRRRFFHAPPTFRASTESAACMLAFHASSERKGLEQIIEIKLTPEEQEALNKSAAAVKELCTVIGVA